MGGGTKETSGDKCIDLFSTKPKGWIKDKTEKSTDDYIYEKEKEEYTFTPGINKPGSSIAAA